MTKRKAPAPAEGKAVTILANEGETEAQTMGRALIEPYFRHGAVTHAVLGKMLGTVPGNAQLDDFGRAIQAKAKATGEGNMALPSEILTAQALSLDTLFTELARRATNNMGDYPQSTERYARLAFKAQSNCRATLEALAKLHQPREQTVRHVHVNEGGQAVIADQFHHHNGGQKNGQSADQPHAQSPRGPALLGPDPLGQALPISSRDGEPAVPDARRQGKRRT